MRREKKVTRTKSLKKLMLPGFITPGVCGLPENENGFSRAVLVYRKEDACFLEMYKLFYHFIKDVDPVQLHLSISTFYFRLLDPKSTALFTDTDQQDDFYKMLDFLAKMAVEKNICLREQQHSLRDNLKD